MVLVVVLHEDERLALIFMKKLIEHTSWTVSDQFLYIKVHGGPVKFAPQILFCTSLSPTWVSCQLYSASFTLALWSTMLCPLSTSPTYVLNSPVQHIWLQLWPNWVCPFSCFQLLHYVIFCHFLLYVLKAHGLHLMACMRCKHYQHYVHIHFHILIVLWLW